MMNRKRKEWYDSHGTWYLGIFKLPKFQPEVQIDKWKIIKKTTMGSKVVQLTKLK